MKLKLKLKTLNTHILDDIHYIECYILKINYSKDHEDHHLLNVLCSKFKYKDVDFL